MNDRKAILPVMPVKILVWLNIFTASAAGLLAAHPLAARIQQSALVITAFYFFIFWILSANIAMLFTKEWGRRSFLVFLWLLILLLNFFLILQTAPFFIDPVAQTTRRTAVFLYISILLPCGFEIIFLTSPGVINSFQKNNLKNR